MRLLAKVAALSTAVAIVVGSGAASAQVKLRAASEEPFGTPPRVAVQYGFEHLRDATPKLTNNAVVVELYANATLGTEKDLIRSVGTGIVDITTTSPGNAGALIPEVQLFSASYLFTSYEHVTRVLANDAFFQRMQKIVEDRKLGFQLAGIGLTGTRNFYTRVKPVDSLDAMRGIKMRVMNSPTEHKVWSTLGTLPTTIPAPEIYSALQTGVIDAAESSLPAIVGGKYYEVAPYITLTHHQFNLMLYFLGSRALAKVPQAARPGLLQALREAGKKQVEAAITMADANLKTLRAQPRVQVVDIDRNALARQLRPIQDEAATSLKVQDLLQMIRAAQ